MIRVFVDPFNESLKRYLYGGDTRNELTFDAVLKSAIGEDYVSSIHAPISVFGSF